MGALLPEPPWRDAPLLRYGGQGAATRFVCGSITAVESGTTTTEPRLPDEKSNATSAIAAPTASAAKAANIRSLAFLDSTAGGSSTGGAAGSGGDRRRNSR